ncbi:EAL domain-containing protein [Kluyvera genomosp. 1]|uniref:EAL domain-containing protein n=1 Tax=Kluyvera genomosp. 1 TaxID=2774053 RepID=UPI0006916828|nr:EAL domain-containing protein [Kluyvera genomosp. 1]
MQTAQWIIRKYLRKRIAVCVTVAICAFALTLGIRFISQRSVNHKQIEMLTNHSVERLNKILLPLETQRSEMLALVGQPCEAIHLQLRKLAVELQTVRSIALIKSGHLYCSSTLGARNVPIHSLQAQLPNPQPLLQLTIDHSLIKGTPILIQWFPASADGQDGVLASINIDLVSSIILEASPPLISHMSLNVGDRYYQHETGITPQLVNSDNSSYTLQSSRFPFSINALSPGPERLALSNLYSELPLAIIMSVLFTWIAWLATAGRLSFSREINMGIAGKEFSLYCQPQMDARVQRCTGVEILLRWNNPRVGWVDPDVFVPIAETQNLIIPLTRYVIGETAKKLHLFPQDPDFQIGINVAAPHFKHGQLLKDLQQSWFSVKPVQQLTIELTERDALHDVDYQVRSDLGNRQIKLAIDDFGTGNSSLSWLEMLHPDVLKIDKSFTGAIGTDAVNSTVTDMIIALAQRLNIELVAEGVETDEQASYLQRHGVHLLQGYLFSQPIPLEDFPRWMAEQEAQTR